MNLNTSFLPTCRIINSILSNWLGGMLRGNIFFFLFRHFYTSHPSIYSLIFFSFFFLGLKSITSNIITNTRHTITLKCSFYLLTHSLLYVCKSKIIFCSIWCCVCKIDWQQEIDARLAFDRWATVICLCWAKRTCGMCWRNIRRHVFAWRRSPLSDWKNIKRRRSKKVCV